MDRRKFLIGGGLGVAAIGTVGAGWWHNVHARDQLGQALVRDALPKLADKADDELASLPGKGQEAIREFFHGKCLNVAPFVREITSPSSVEKLRGCRNDDERDRVLWASFLARVVDPAEILGEVKRIARVLGRELDERWNACSKEVIAQWNLRLPRPKRAKLVEVHFMQQIDQLVQADLKAALASAQASGTRPALGDTLSKIGESAILLLPLAHAPKVMLPLFVLVATGPVLRYIVGLLADPKPEMQSAISGRLALLGNQVGDELADEIGSRLTDLHRWQEQSMREMARKASWGEL